MKKPILFAVVEAHGSASILELVGRDAWALSELLRAGDGGCTVFDHPAPRWSAYVFKLRRVGLDIQTVTEAHGGPYRGTHARYVLRSQVRRLTPYQGLSEAA